MSKKEEQDIKVKDDLTEADGPWQNNVIVLLSDHVFWAGICIGFIAGCFGGAIFVQTFI